MELLLSGYNNVGYYMATMMSLFVSNRDESNVPSSLARGSESGNDVCMYVPGGHA